MSSLLLIGAVLSVGGAAIVGIQAYFERHERRRIAEEERGASFGYVLQVHAAIEAHNQRLATMAQMGIRSIDVTEFIEEEAA